MQIQVNTDHNIKGHEGLVAHVNGLLESVLGRTSDHITRVEVHLSDETSRNKSGMDVMRCLMEARLEHHQPVAVTHHAETVEYAIQGAADKLERLIEHTIGRLRSGKVRGAALPREIAEEPEEA